MEEILATTQLVPLNLHAEVQVSPGFPNSHAHVLRIHTPVIGSTKDTEISAGWASNDPVRIIVLDDLNALIAMVFSTEVPVPSMGMRR